MLCGKSIKTFHNNYIITTKKMYFLSSLAVYTTSFIFRVQLLHFRVQMCHFLCTQRAKKLYKKVKKNEQKLFVYNSQKNVQNNLIRCLSFHFLKLCLRTQLSISLRSAPTALWKMYPKKPIFRGKKIPKPSGTKKCQRFRQPTTTYQKVFFFALPIWR